MQPFLEIYRSEGEAGLQAKLTEAGYNTDRIEAILMNVRVVVAYEQGGKLRVAKLLKANGMPAKHIPHFLAQMEDMYKLSEEA